MITTFSLMILYTTGTIVYADDFPNQKLPLSTSGCEGINVTHSSSSTVTYNYINYEDPHYSKSNLWRAPSEWKGNEDSFLIKFLSLSYMWYSGLGCILMVVFGILFSFMFNYFTNVAPRRVDSTCISPPILRLWNKLLTKERMKVWINFDDKVKFQVSDSEVVSSLEIKTSL